MAACKAVGNIINALEATPTPRASVFLECCVCCRSADLVGSVGAYRLALGRWQAFPYLVYITQVAPKSMWRQAGRLASACRYISADVQTQAARLLSTAAGPQVGRLNHIAIAVPDLEAAAAAYSKVLGTQVSAPQSLPEHGVRVVFVSLENAKLELLEPLGAASPIANFLKKNPAGGVHHLCLEVPEIGAAVGHVAATGVRLLDPNPTIGAHGTPVVVLHPKDMCGVLTELEEVKREG